MSTNIRPGAGHPSVEGLPVAWRRQAKTLRRYGGETPAVVLDRCAADLEATLQELDETTLSLVEAARESGYSADHLGRLVREGKIPNAGRSGAPRIARRHLPRKAPAVVLDRCAADLEATLQELDETTLSLVEAARESGYSADHLGRLVREGKIPNAGRSGAPRIARRHLPRKAPAEPQLARTPRRRELSSRQIVQSIIERGIE